VSNTIALLLLAVAVFATGREATHTELAAAPPPPPPAPAPHVSATYSQLGELVILKNVAKRDLEVAIDAAQRRTEHNPAAFLGLAAGIFTTAFTLNPKAGLAAAGATQQIANAVRGTDDPELRSALLLFEQRMGRIAELEQLYDLPPGVPSEYLVTLMEALGPDAEQIARAAALEARLNTPVALTAQALHDKIAFRNTRNRSEF